MYDQSYNTDVLHRELRKSDFRKYNALYVEAEKAATIAAAVAAASNIFFGANPLQSFHYKKRALFRIAKLPNELVVRKLTRNLRYALKARATGREHIVTNLISILREGVPYRVYRLDIKDFYDSIDQEDLLKKLSAMQDLGPISFRILQAILRYYSAAGGKGIPRGLALSAVLAEVALNSFDKKIAYQSGVFFFARYVDDIVIITSNDEDPGKFLQGIKTNLPPGLQLNELKTCYESVNARVSPRRSSSSLTIPPICRLNFLGYELIVCEPTKSGSRQDHQYHREVEVDISDRKVKKIKTRIVRSFLEFWRDRNFVDLLDRITFLTSNYSIHDYNTGKRKLAGIYYGYPQLVAGNSKSLKTLDGFLRNAILSKSGRLFSRTSATLSSNQKRALLSRSFVRGHTKRSFVNFSMNRVGEIQRCWIHE